VSTAAAVAAYRAAHDLSAERRADRFRLLVDIGFDKLDIGELRELQGLCRVIRDQVSPEDVLVPFLNEMVLHLEVAVERQEGKASK
jgi:hypothetical protein